ncbi:MAG: hypothetical protein KUG77_07255 [Nannocystaceae bacterium]|nr:hypothetical protein [Nannocystaceae bacterium]
MTRPKAPLAAMWCCPNCELPCPMHQRRCGACRAPRGDDVGALSVAETLAFLADSAFFKRFRKRKKT